MLNDEREKKMNEKKIMKLYVIKYENGKEKVSVRITNELTGESVYWNGYLEWLMEEKAWGEKGKLLAVSSLEREWKKRE